VIAEAPLFPNQPAAQSPTEEIKTVGPMQGQLRSPSKSSIDLFSDEDPNDPTVQVDFDDIPPAESRSTLNLRFGSNSNPNLLASDDSTLGDDDDDNNDEPLETLAAPTTPPALEDDDEPDPFAGFDPPPELSGPASMVGPRPGFPAPSPQPPSGSHSTLEPAPKPDSPGSALELASPVWRGVARVADTGVLAGTLYLGFYAAETLRLEPGTSTIAVRIGPVILLLVVRAGLLGTRGQDFGKILCRLVILRQDGTPAGLRSAFLARELVLGTLVGMPLALSFTNEFQAVVQAVCQGNASAADAVLATLRGALATALAVDLLCGLGPKRECLHDRLAGTCVASAP
jgi:uncharacterized RDD family membrane protein YckC